MQILWQVYVGYVHGPVSLPGLNSRSAVIYATDQLIVFGLNISNDMPSSHPASFFYSFYQWILHLRRFLAIL